MKVIIVFAILLWCTSAHAQEPSQPDPPWRADSSLVGVISNGVFSDDSGPGNDVAMVYRIAGAYIVGLPTSELQFFGRLSAGHVVVTDFEDSDRFGFSRLSLGSLWTGYEIPWAGTIPTVELGFLLPTHDGAEFTTEQGIVEFKARLQQPVFDVLRLGVEVGATKLFHENKGIQLDASTQNSPYATGGINTEFTYTVGANARAQFTPRVRMDMKYSYRRYFAYDRDIEDEFTPNFEDLSRGSIGLTLFKLEAGYRFLDLSDVSVELFGSWKTIQTPRTSDNKTNNFPLWSLPETRNSVISIGVIGRFGKRKPFEPRFFR